MSSMVKPHPEPYLKGLQKAHAMPDEAFIIENAPLGVKAGVAAGVFTIAVNTGPIPEKQLQEAGSRLDLSGYVGFTKVFAATTGRTS